MTGLGERPAVPIGLVSRFGGINRGEGEEIFAAGTKIFWFP